MSVDNDERRKSRKNGRSGAGAQRAERFVCTMMRRSNGRRGNVMNGRVSLNNLSQFLKSTASNLISEIF